MIKNKNKKSILCVLILFILTMVFFWEVLINPDKIIYPVPDIVNTHAFWKILFHNTFKMHGEIPFWNPFETAGGPFLGNFNSAMFYPFNTLFLIFNPDFVFGYIFFIDMFLAGVFMFLLARYLKLDYTSSLLSSIVYMFGGIFIGRISIGHSVITDVILWTPLIFLFFLKTLEKGKFSYAIFTGIFLGIQILAGHLQFAIYTIYALIGYFLFNCFIINRVKIKNLIRSIYLISLIFLIGFLVSAVELLPAIELSGLSIHGGSKIDYSFLTSDANSYSITPRYLISFLMPDFFGSRVDKTYWATEQFEEVTSYIGILPLIFSSFSIIFVRNKYIIFFTLLGLISLFFAFGQYNPAFPYLHKIILFFDVVRNPARFLFLFAFSFSVLSGFGFSFLKQLLKRRDKRLYALIKLLLMGTAITAAAVLLVYAYKDLIISLGENKFNTIVAKLSTPSPDRIGNYVLDYYLKNKIDIIDKIYWYILGNLVKLVAILSSTIVLLFLRIRHKINVNYILLALLIIVILDLWHFGMKYVDVAPLEKVYSSNNVIDFVAKDASIEKFRVIGLNRTLDSRFAGRNGIEILDGFVPPSLKYYADYIATMENIQLDDANPVPIIRNLSNPIMLDLLNVKYILSTEEFGNGRYTLVSVSNVSSFDIRKQLEFNQTIYLYRNENRLPRAFVVSKYLVLSNKTEILTELKKPEFNPNDIIILEKNPLIPNNTQARWVASISFYSPNKITLNVKMSQPGFLVLSEIWYPDWRVFYFVCNTGVCSDEKIEAHIYKTDYILRSVYLDRGEYKIEFIYDSLGGMTKQ